MDSFTGVLGYIFVASKQQYDLLWDSCILRVVLVNFCVDLPGASNLQRLKLGNRDVVLSPSRQQSLLNPMTLLHQSNLTQCTRPQELEARKKAWTFQQRVPQCFTKRAASVSSWPLRKASLHLFHESVFCRRAMDLSCCYIKPQWLSEWLLKIWSFNNLMFQKFQHFLEIELKKFSSHSVIQTRWNPHHGLYIFLNDCGTNCNDSRRRLCQDLSWRAKRLSQPENVLIMTNLDPSATELAQ